MFKRSISNNHEHWGHTKLEVVWYFNEKLVWNLTTSTKDCLESWGLFWWEMQSRNSKIANPCGWRKVFAPSSNEISQICLVGLGAGSAIGFLAPEFFRFGTWLFLVLSQPKFQLTGMNSQLLRGHLSGQACSSTRLMHCINWFWRLVQKFGSQQALCLVLIVHQLGNMFGKVNPSHIPLWNKWERCHPQKKLDIFVYHFVLTWVYVQIKFSKESWNCLPWKGP